MPENGGYLPLLFYFPRPESKSYTETIRTLARLARFVIVGLSGPSVPQEITATVDLFEIPFVPILEQNRKDWSMFKDLLVKERVLKPVRPSASLIRSTCFNYWPEKSSRAPREVDREAPAAP
jgi:hypothetical protein